MTREEKMTDLIQMYSYFAQFSNEQSKCHCEALQMAIEALQEQKTGKWQKYEGRFDYNWECSECECSSYEKTSYCAHCGARMENEE